MNASLIELSNGFAEAVEHVGRSIVSVNEVGPRWCQWHDLARWPDRNGRTYHPRPAGADD